VEYVSDLDGDGYWSSIKVGWDANVNFGSSQVYAKVFVDQIIGEVEVGKSSNYTITGNEVDWVWLTINTDACGSTRRGRHLLCLPHGPNRTRI